MGNGIVTKLGVLVLLAPFVGVLSCGAEDTPKEPVEPHTEARGLALGAELARGDATLTAALGSGTSDFRAEGSRIVARSAAAPSHADGTFEVRASSSDPRVVRLTSVGARPAVAELHQGRLQYAEAFPKTDLIAVSLPGKWEQLLVLREPAAPTELAWRVELVGLTDVRAKPDGSLDFADAGGTVLHMPRPFLVDSRGVRRDADAVYADGTLTVRFDPAGLSYPLLLDPALTTGSWTQVFSGGTPPGLEITALAFDSVNKKVVMYGGWKGCCNNPEEDDTWLWDGFVWAKSSITGTGGRTFHSMAFDDVRSKLVVFGGAKGGTQLGDTWESDGVSNWVKINTANDPGARSQAMMAFDPVAKVTRLFGGYVGSAPVGDFWSYDGTNWTKVNDAGPPARRAGSLTYDNKRQKLVLFGGVSAAGAVLNDTWEWDAATGWLQRFPAQSPPARAEFGMAYDTARGRTVVTGGPAQWLAPQLTDTWEWDGTNWSKVTDGVGPGNDGGRTRTYLAFDSNRRRMVAAGGTYHTYGSTVWEYYVFGDACATNADCDTKFCVDGVCCKTPSCGTCQVCNGTTPGTCTSVVNVDDGDSCPSATSTCDGSSQCKLKQGQACSAGSACASTYCVDSVCCASACTAACSACSAAKKGTGSDGACGSVVAGSDPDDDCADLGAASCQQNGQCNGSGFCQYYASGTPCGATTCSNGTQSGKSCNGTGTCVTANVTACSPYFCASASACATTCNDDTSCVADHFCRASDKTCQPDQDNGAACTNKSQCKSGFCADGVCCDTACDGLCQACSKTAKGFGADGKCDNVNDGLDPHDDCPTAAPSTCQHDGKCNGKGACRYYAAGTACGSTPTKCVGNKVTGDVCPGGGSPCTVNTSGVDCAPYVCKNDACANPCTTAADCLGDAFCDQGTCKTKQQNGAGCTSGSACVSGNCVDGYCCNGACTGQCEACDVPTALGICTAVSGVPHGARPPCAGTPGDACVGACDGTSTGKCAYPGNAKQCAAGCDAGSESVGFCDSAGACQASSKKASCAPYVCGAVACKTTCTANDECVSGYHCATDGTCEKNPTVAVCDGDHTVTAPDGTKTDCAPYKCDPTGACKTGCSNAAECVSPNVCNTSGKCTALSSSGKSAADEGGCGCRVTGRGSAEAAGASVLLLFGVAGLWRRRRASSRRRAA